MALTLWQSAPAFLFQGGDTDQLLQWMLVGAIILSILAMGLQFFKNVFYAITAPTYSLKSMGQDDNFFFSLLLVVVGGLFMSLYALMQKSFLLASFEQFARDQLNGALVGYANQTYKPVVFEFGLNRMTDVFDLVMSSILGIVLLWPVLWLLFGYVYWILSRAFGNQLSLKVMLSTLAYYYLLFGVVVGYFAIHSVGAYLVAQGGAPPIGGLEIAGVILGLVALAYSVISISQGSDITVAQAVVVFVIWGVVLGGIIAAVFVYQLAPIYEGFLDGLRSQSYA
ncbi:hypothetical protein J7J84_07870 [bacterium]|nr:hypothetical protein [bacterium]